ncbi:ABC transporter ATP-binding protein [Ornithinibacillus halophilus]|uniref:ABC-2 type transport system ATP-binding protein n=1 Tax=Ornithinibacillus halophilus TaxID=930117 RepID=A0A1M5MNW0_9BACI|nr:ABC transporter ATP-binding protein [Ornithinibacillus halophilus]SHG78935.1 ABC-2 type transport system ATP-binding protein [Ornithinibacillus halophilus]
MALIKVNNLSKRYGNKTAVNNVNFDFERGKCIALIGPNGAGKTTILRTLSGLLKPTSGTIQFADEKENSDIRPHIGYLPQYPSFYGWMTGREFLIFSGELAYLSKDEAKKRADELLKKIGISEGASNERISRYSGGMKQRLGIAQAIIHRPKLLILDEPVSSLDPIGRREVMTLMEELKNEMTILFSTHILSDADEISDELLLLHNGEIVESGSMDELRAKYQTSKIELAFENDLEEYKEKIDQLNIVSDSMIERGLLHVTASDISQARKAILETASQEDWPLTTFTINRASLEDMFMKVVNK